MSNDNQFGYACPKCGEGDSLDVEATVFVRLTADGTDTLDTRNGDHEWDDGSFVSCGCDWTGKVGDLTKDNDEIDCGQCEGTGETDAMGEREQCPVCDGTGKIEEEQ